MSSATVTISTSTTKHSDLNSVIRAGAYNYYYLYLMYRKLSRGFLTENEKKIGLIIAAYQVYVIASDPGSFIFVAGATLATPGLLFTMPVQTAEVLIGLK